LSLEAIFSEAKDCLARGEFDQAKDLGHQLLKMRFSGAFEILAKSFHGKGQLPVALQVLESGVQEAPSVWSLWMQLGNYRSESGDLQGALEAYEAARDCPGAENDQIDFNEAFMRLKFGNREKALEMFHRVLQTTKDKRLRLVSLTHRLLTLMELDRVTEALMELGEAYLHEEDNAELLGTLAKKLLQLGDRVNALNLAKQSLGLRRAGEAARVVRLIEGLPSTECQLFEVKLRGRLEDDDGKWLTFNKTSLVYADSEEEAQAMAIAFEPPDVRADLVVEDVRVTSGDKSELKGVDWSSPLEFL